MNHLFRQTVRFATISLLILIMAACSVGPLGGSDGNANPAASPGTDDTTPTQPAKLPIVTPTVVVPGSVPEPGPEGTGTPAELPATYIVKEGDTLYAIALLYGVELDRIIELNGLSDPNDIWVGQELQMPSRE